MIDLRSDTVTKPSKEMREAIASAEVGDDVFDADPTIAALEERTAALTGKEAALFVLTGTMANELAIQLHTSPGDEMILEATSHPINYEAGGPSALAGVATRAIEGKSGLMEPKVVEAAIRRRTDYHPRSRLLVIENTHNFGGGVIYPLGLIDDLTAIAKQSGLATHLDGARIFNASVASDVAVADYAARFDTLSFCLSKGLGAPAGSMLCGTKAMIDEAKWYRYRMGGAWRQGGILAAAGLYALEHNIERLKVDHYNASLLAEGIGNILPLEVVNEVETNMVLFRFRRTDERSLAEPFIELCRSNGVFFNEQSQGHTMRAVTHLDVGAKDIKTAISVMNQAATTLIA